MEAWNAVIPGDNFSLNGLWWLLVITHAFIVLQKLFQAHHDEQNYVKAQVSSTFAMILQVISLLEVLRNLALFNSGFFDAAKDVDPTAVANLASFRLWLWIEVAMFCFFLFGTALFLLLRSQCKARRDRDPTDFQETTKDFLEYAFLSGLPESFVTFFAQTALFGLLKYNCIRGAGAQGECTPFEFDAGNKWGLWSKDFNVSTVDYELFFSMFQFITITMLSFTGLYNVCFARKGRPICLAVFTCIAFLLTPLLFVAYFAKVMAPNVIDENGKVHLAQALEAPTVLAFFIQLIAFPLKMF